MGIALRQEPYFEEEEGRTKINEFLSFINLPENQDRTYELIDGYIVMMAGNASSNHHRISMYIAAKLYRHLEGKKCEVHQDINVYLFREDIGKCKNAFQPDVMVGCEPDKFTDNGYEGTPDFVVEVVSKSSARNDYLRKFQHYILFGVKEYWIIDPFQEKIVVYINNDEHRPQIFLYTFEDIVKISILDGFAIDFKQIKRLLSPSP
jgi:Uma2 family endonuclease